MKNLKSISFFVVILLICTINVKSQELLQNWETTTMPQNVVFHDIYFPNAEYGTAIGTNQSGNTVLYKSSNKGLNWSLDKNFNNSGATYASMDFTNPGEGIVLVLDNGVNKVYKTQDGGANWQNVLTIPSVIVNPRIRLINSIIYSFSYGKDKLYAFDEPVLDFNNINYYLTNVKFNPITGHGYASGYSLISGIYKPILAHFDDGEFDELIFDGSTDPEEVGAIFDFDIVENSEVGYIAGLTNNGLVRGAIDYLFITTDINYEQVTLHPDASSNIKVTSHTAEVSGGLIEIEDYIFSTTNAGTNWIGETYGGDLSQFQDFQSSQDVAYILGDDGTKLLRRKLKTNLYTNFDFSNPSGSGNFLVSGTSYNTPSSPFLRGGYSTLFAPATLNSGQQIFYYWELDSSMSNTSNIYFSSLETDITANYKTKQLSTIPSSISTPSQTKSIRDTIVSGVTVTHTIHESMGGIFYSKSTNYGATYQTEETVNIGSLDDAVGNKNASLCVIRSISGNTPVTPYDANRNVAIAWEHYNSTTGKIEIKVAHRILNTSNNGYEWQRIDSTGRDYFTAFTAPSTFESKPTCFVLAPYSSLQNPTTLTIIVPHLKYTTTQNKLVTTVKYNTQCQEYELDNGNIQEVSVTSPYNSYYGQYVYFAYIKGDSVAYRREGFGNNNGTIFRQSGPEVKNNISSGDGYTSRYSPDISLMDTVPVVTYSASYYATRLVQFENNGGTEEIPVTRFPVVKVQRINANTWGNYVVYSSNNFQEKPDIEGSKTNLAYIINYSYGNGQFKKVAGVTGYPGYFCQPSIFTGTDSRLINNSYSGLFGSNLTLLTLAPQSSLYKLDKQNFIITNYSAADEFNVDNIDGVVNLDTIRYSFRLGPIFIQDNLGGIVGGIFGNSSESEEPILNGIDFNENLKSNPFLLNENQALLIQSNAIYLKDNNYYSISEIPYTVKLMNVRTDTLHRILFRDTIRAGDSIETEFLRGFYITNIPNDEDSFYVKMEVDHAFDNADYYVNPIYYDPFGPEGPSNSNGQQHLAVIFENENITNEVETTPTEFKLSQNFPNPFNPSTNIQYSIPKDNLVKLKIYDILGKELIVLVNEFKHAGSYKATFDGKDLPSGLYFYRIEAGDFVQVKKMMLVK